MKFIAVFLLSFLMFISSLSAQVPPSSTGSEAQVTDITDIPSDPSLSVDALIKILQDDVARDQLIESLQLSLDDGQTDASSADAEPPEASRAIGTSMARVIADQTRSIAEKGLIVVQSFDKMTDDIVLALADSGRIDLGQLTLTLTQLGLAIGVVFGTFIALRIGVEAILRVFDRQAVRRGTWTVKASLLVPSIVVEALAVAVAWAMGYGFSLYFGNAGQMSIYQTLFLNAFLFIEAAKLVFRVGLMPRHAPLRLAPLSDTGASYWYFWSSRIISLLGYGILFAVPVINAEMSYRVGTAVHEIVVFFALLLVVVLVLQNKARVRHALHRPLDEGKTDVLSRFLALIGNQWHRLMIAYLLVFFVIWMTDPGQAVAFMTTATIRSIVAVLVGAAITVGISRLITLGLRLPKEVQEKLPLLEGRLNAFVPTVLKGVRLVVAVAVALTVADAWSLMEVAEWFVSSEGQGLLAAAASVFVILAVGSLIYLAMASWVEFRLNPAVGAIPSPREITLLSLLRNAFTILLVIVLLMMVLSELGVNIGPLIAGAGVFGLAISFGAQKFVQDVITGIFIQFENAMNTGDVVTVAGITGVVEKLTIRSVSIRSLDGTLHFVPFSSVDAVSNFMKHFSFHVAEIGVAYRENISEVKEAMHEAFDRLRQVDDYAAVILDDLEMHGVTQLAESAVVVRARIRTIPGSQWSVGRAYSELVKVVFDERGIEIPFPHMKLYMGETKPGLVPPLPLVQGPAADTDAQPAARPTAQRQDGDDLADVRKTEITPLNQDGPFDD
ncbi:mechanosensitive ion channel domain-containing protein [Pseudoruegeria sp. SK021]|uniref:mechanosensitive ion channel domain-containing protein n=1 Tax=Pseudoruegeria sp. SK021 TaxID=1933035 RepID=UPI000A261E23|nr:mechanosensitive ion channel domain-containing protein [Pseudoruegeria sp. SK021]OSP53610.1 mechanosensitive ion channel protein MscS [Pseudoruegeria sp. SK021]